MATSRYNNAQQAGLFAVPAIPAPAATRRRSRPADAEEQELRLATLERERREVQQELFEAAQVQRRLSGSRRLRLGPFEVASEVFAVRHLSGDFVCTMDIAEQTWFAVGDIAGKGLTAAMWFTHLVSLIRCYGAAHGHPSAVMSALNADLCKLQPEPPLTSLVLLVLNQESGQLEFCNGGHPAPLLFRRERHLERLEAGGPLLGVVSGARYESARVELRAGDVLLSCTDGILECRNSADEEFGGARLIDVTCTHVDEPAQALLFSILGAVQDFAGSTPRQDDISLLVLRHAGEHIY